MLHAIVAVILAGGYLAASYSMFLYGWYFPVIAGVLAVFVPFVTVYISRAISNHYEKEAIRNMFSKHIDPSIVNTLIEK